MSNYSVISPASLSYTSLSAFLKPSSPYWIIVLQPSLYSTPNPILSHHFLPRTPTISPTIFCFQFQSLWYLLESTCATSPMSLPWTSPLNSPQHCIFLSPVSYILITSILSPMKWGKPPNPLFLQKPYYYYCRKSWHLHPEEILPLFFILLQLPPCQQSFHWLTFYSKVLLLYNSHHQLWNPNQFSKPRSPIRACCSNEYLSISCINCISHAQGSWPIDIWPFYYLYLYTAPL